MGFPSNLAAINAANKMMIAAYASARAELATAEMKAFRNHHFAIEKLDGEWHARIINPFPAPRDPLLCLLDEREGIYPFPKASEASQQALTDADDDFEAAQARADAEANAQQSESMVDGKIWIRISSVPKPTKLVWAIADEMNAAARDAGQPAPTRKEVQDECIRRGIATGTARTQYQAWKTATDNARANAEHAAQLSEKFRNRS